MKTAIVIASLFAFNAHAFLGFPPAAEMNKVTVEQVKEVIAESASLSRTVGSSYSIETVSLNNKYEITTTSGCVFSAKVSWGDFGWSSEYNNIEAVKLKKVSCN